MRLHKALYSVAPVPLLLCAVTILISCTRPEKNDTRSALVSTSKTAAPERAMKAISASPRQTDTVFASLDPARGDNNDTRHDTNLQEQSEHNLPPEHNPRLATAVDLLRERRFGEALAILDEITEHDADPKALLARAQANALLGQYTRARRDFAAAIHQIGDSECYRNRGIFNLMAGHNLAALADLEIAQGKDPSALNQLLVRMATGIAAESERSNDGIAEETTGNPQGLPRDPEMIQSGGNEKESRTDRAVAQSGIPAGSLSEWGDITVRAFEYAVLENDKAAMREFTLAIQLEDSTAAYVGRGILSFIEEKYLPARYDLGVAASLEPSPLNQMLAVFASNCSSRQIAKNASSRRASSLRNALDRQRKEHMELALWAFERQDFDRAVDEYTSAIELDLHFRELYLLRAKAHLANHSPAAAEKDLSRYMVMGVASSEAYELRAQAYFDEEWWSRVVYNATEAILLDPLSATAFRLRGSAYGRIGNTELAEQDLLNAMYLAGRANREEIRLEAEKSLRDLHQRLRTKTVSSASSVPVGRYGITLAPSIRDANWLYMFPAGMVATPFSYVFQIQAELGL